MFDPAQVFLRFQALESRGCALPEGANCGDVYQGEGTGPDGPEADSLQFSHQQKGGSNDFPWETHRKSIGTWF